jgi:hypothetical protein
MIMNNDMEQKTANNRTVYASYPQSGYDAAFGGSGYEPWEGAQRDHSEREAKGATAGAA